jgi:hypothetical protein
MSDWIIFTYTVWQFIRAAFVVSLGGRKILVQARSLAPATLPNVGPGNTN